MSLKVGTLVIIVRSVSYPEYVGRIAEILEELQYLEVYSYRTGKKNTDYFYRIKLGDECWFALPSQVVPITPPNGEEDVNDYVPDHRIDQLKPELL